jgi:PEP-CTERM motif-containing protein
MFLQAPKQRVGRCVLTLVALCAIAVPAAATTISFQATDVADRLQGEDLYLYAYTLSDFEYPAGYGFTVVFDRLLYSSLQVPSRPVGTDWDVLAIQPDFALPDDGLFDAMALVDAPATLTGFAIEFVWLGAGVPGGQPFVVYDSTFATVESGLTVAAPILPDPGVPVPEPASGILLGLGALLCARWRIK